MKESRNSKGIITTEKEFNTIVNDGCINCEGKDFSYFGVSDIYTCNCCGTKYALTTKAVISLIKSLDPVDQIETYIHEETAMSEDENIRNVLKIRQRKLPRKTINYSVSER